MTDQQVERLSRVIQALTEPVRLYIVLLLVEHGELAVKDIRQRLQIPQSSVSGKLAKLTRLNLIQPRRDGILVYYSLVDPLSIREDLIRKLGQLIPSAMASTESN